MPGSRRRACPDRPGRFADPTALTLLRPDEREAVQWVRDGVPPRTWRQRIDYETVRAAAELMAPRTIAIDDAIRAHPSRQLVILGAGLDGRAWRMPELAGVAVFEVDQPATQQDKRERAAGLPGTPPRFVPVDFGRDRLAATLAAHGHRADLATTWVWEGVVPYLTRAEVAATVAELATCSAPGSRLVVNFQSHAASTALGRVVARLLMASTGRSRLTYEIAERGNGVTSLTVTHELEGAPQTLAQVAGEVEGAGGGWAEILSDLKSLLETGSPLYA
ncbi:SAM-dependent methyltransferase [Micromonospora chersina]|uniref:SAM-dependent methyltransferase n=1 Tax=Micromonospora chersina TaxID=47854 RepID=UPI0037184CD7